MQLLSGDTWGLLQQEIAGSPIRPFSTQAMLSHVPAEPHKRVLEYLRIDVRMCKDGFRVGSFICQEQ